MDIRKTLKEIADLVQGEVVGTKNPDETHILGTGSIEHAHPGQITFLGNDRYLPFLEKTKATAILVKEQLKTDIPQLMVPNPKLAFAKVSALFSVFPKLPSGISPQALRSENVTVGKDVTVGPFVYLGKEVILGDRVIIYPGAFIGDGVRVGDDSVIFPNVTLYQAVVLGKRTIVHAGTVLGADGFGYVSDGKGHRKVPQVGVLVIEDDVEIGANSAIDRATIDQTRIGQGTKIDNLVQVGHNCHIGPMNLLCGHVGLAGGVRSGTGVVFAGQVGVADQVQIEDGVKFGAQAGAVGNKTFEAHQSFWGTPASKARDWIKQLAFLKKLPELYKRVKLLEKKLTQLLDK